MTMVNQNVRVTEEPYASSPTRTPKVGFYCRHPGSRSNIWHFNFYGLYAARKFIEFVCANNKFKWVDDNRIMTADGIEVWGSGSEDLELACTYKYRLDEADWNPDSITIRNWERFIIGSLGGDKTDAEEEGPDKELKRIVRLKRTSEGVVTLRELCKQVGVSDEKKARMRLRKRGVIKPRAGWMWENDKVDDIIPIIRGEYDS